MRNGRWREGERRQQGRDRITLLDLVLSVFAFSPSIVEAVVSPFGAGISKRLRRVR